ncbi:Glycosyltransferase involved in cell wall bisynthesis [Lishizhenia tianjinensis]|uniref:Glycosyltransferase involved in cell wall bisynthesis n=1 Tax=Lishizhenia tianjinensis TaxID=477690 RepID=A0A1I7BM87_9FLAO|nr:glycosyltransferase [Lishizhenia tianjinensis]SFT88282.1 Glycosyltransferase involved in cell wall bisynthesis [Lishizhenia tianjinensis]
MTKKIKILRIINRFNIGGPTFNATFLTAFLSDEFETKLIGGVPDEGEKDSLHILQQYGVEPQIITSLQRNPNYKSDREAYKEIKQIIKEFQPDIVHTHASKAGALGRKAAHACKVPVIVHTFHGHVFHSYFGKFKTKLFQQIERNLAKKSSQIIAISPLQKHELTTEYKICSPDKTSVIPLGFDLAKFQLNLEGNRTRIREQYNITQEEVALAIVGRLAPIKDHDFFLDAIEELAQRTTRKFKVFIVGDGSEYSAIHARVQYLKAKYGCEIIMTSWIKDIAEFNAGMDVICLSSKNEGTPVSLIEAQATNLPVLSTDVGGVRDIVLDGETGFIVEKGNLETYTEKLRLLIENDELRISMGQKGYPHVSEKFHYSRLVKDMERLYKQLLEK